jgi:uncharacterized membrane protein YfcA
MLLHPLVAVGLGAVIGLSSGLLGVGGSSVATPLLRIFGTPRFLALGTPLPVNLPTAIVGGIVYALKGRVRGRIVLWTSLAGAPAVVAGSYLTGHMPGRVLMGLTGAFVTAAGAWLMRRGIGLADRPQWSPVWLLLALGGVVGVLSGLLANGGGFLLVPAYLVLCRLSAQEAAATSLVVASFLAIPGTVVHMRLGHIDLNLAIHLAIGAVPATYLGARVGLALKRRHARWVFALFLLGLGLFFLARTFYRAEMYGWFS